jgi:hypothetical protein
MTARTRKWLVVVGVLIVLALGTLVLVTLGPTAPLRPLPHPNGYDDFLKAGAAVTANVGNYTAMSNEALRELVLTNAECLHRLRLGLTRQCAVPPDTAMTNMPAMINQLSGMKRLAQLLAAEGLLHQLDHQTVEAVHTYVDAIRFGNEISRGGILINRLVGVAIEAIGRAPLAKLVPSLTPAQARQLIADLEKIDASRVSWDEVRAAERRYARHYMASQANPMVWIVGWWQSIGAVKRAVGRHNSVVAQERLLMIELALRCYRADQACPPARLEDLVPAYLAKLPQDPYTGRPMIYRLHGTNWLVYSVGPDLVDNGGRPMARINTAPGDLLYDRP